MFLIVLVLHTLSAAPLHEDLLVQEGMRLYGDFDYEKAAFRFRAALRDQSRSAADRATILVWLGMTHAELGDWPATDKAFEEALLANPRVELPSDAAPKIRNLFDQARRRFHENAGLRSSEATSAQERKHPDAAPHGTSGDLNTFGGAGGLRSAPAGSDGANSRWLLWGGGAAMACGAVAFGGGGILGAVAAAKNAEALRAEFQDDAVRARDASRDNQMAANASFVIGTGLIITGVAAAVVDLMSEEAR